MKNKVPSFIIKNTDPKFFCDRETETKLIAETLLEKRNVLLLSRSGVGKTALISRVLNDLAKSNYTKHIYLDLIKYSSPKQFILDFLHFEIELFSQNSNKKRKKVKNLIFGSNMNLLSLNDYSEIDIFEFYRSAVDYMGSRNEPTFVVIDNYQMGAHFSYDRFGKSILEPLIKNDNTPLLLSGTKKFLSLINFEEVILENINNEILMEFLDTKLSKKGYSISKKALQKIFYWSRGDTQVISLLYAKLLRGKNKKIKLSDIYKVIDKIIGEYNHSFSQVHKLLSSYQWKLLKAIAVQEDPFQITSAKFIYRYELNAPSSVKTALDSLLEKELIFKESNHYLVSDVIFCRWLTQNRS